MIRMIDVKGNEKREAAQMGHVSLPLPACLRKLQYKSVYCTV